MAVTDLERRAPPGDASTDELSVDVVFDLLSNRRRRLVLHYLSDESEASTLSELAEHVAAIESGKSEEALTYSERKRAYVALYQCHLPRLDAAGVVDFDGRDRVELADAATALELYLTRDTGSDEPSQARVAATFVAGGGVGAAGSFGVLRYGASPVIALVVLLALAVAVAAWRPGESVGSARSTIRAHDRLPR